MMRLSALRAATLALAAGTVLATYGCTERLEGGAACPILCPGQDVELREIVLDGVVLDTTVSSYPAIGDESELTLIARGDTIDTRVIVRFDTLPSTFRLPNSPDDRPIESVTDAKLEIRLEYPARSPDQSITVEAYDVDTVTTDAASDTLAATMLPLFRPDRFLGALTFKPSDLTGEGQDSTARIPIDNAYLLAKVQAQGRLRVGLRVRAGEPGEVVFLGANAGRAQRLEYTVSTDPIVEVGTGPYSATPAERFIANGLADFVIVAQRRPRDTPPEVLAIGGIPGQRAYLRFSLPSRIIDSTSVIRATLLLTQYPNRLAVHGPDSLVVFPQPVVASDVITDVQKAANLLAAERSFRLDSLRTAPDDSGQVAIEAVGLLSAWRTYQPNQLSRAVVLKLPFGSEGIVTDEIYVFSSEAAANLRPRLRIVYVPRLDIGLP